MVLNIRIFIIFIISLVSINFLFGKPRSNKPETVVLNLKWYHQFQFAGYYAAQYKGFYKAEGLDVVINEGGANNSQVDSVLSGNANFGVGDAEILLQKLNGKPIVLLAAIFQHSPLVLLTKYEKGYRKPSDLIGKTVMLQTGFDCDPIKAIFYKEGISLDKIKIVPLEYSLDKLINGEVDARTAYTTGEVQLLKEKGIEPYIIYPIDYGVDFYGDMLFTCEREVNNNPNLVSAFKRASIKGWEYALKNKDEIINYILTLESVKKRGTTKEQLQKEAKLIQDLILPNFIEIGHINPGRIETMVKIYSDMGLIKSKYTLEGFYYNPTEKELPNWVKFTLIIFGITTILVIIGFLSIVQLRNIINKKTSQLLEEIDHRKKIEEFLRKSEEKYRLLAENSNDVIWTLDLKSMKFTYISPSVFKLRGYTVEEAMKESIEKSLTPKSYEFIKIGLPIRLNAFKNNDPSSIVNVHEIVQPCKDGTLVNVEVVTTLITDINGEVKEILGVSRNITERKKTEELKKNVEIAQRSAEIKQQFLANMSHEIRTPMIGIIGMTEFLLKTNLDTKQLDYVNTIKNSSDSLLNLINDILDLSKLEAGHIEIKNKFFNIDIIIDKITSMFDTLIQQKNLHLIIEKSADFPKYIEADDRRIMQVLTNFVSNAVKFSEKGAIKISFLADKIDENNVKIKIEVADNGIGISEENQKKLFSKFTQLDSSDTRKFKGTGLGLAICKEFVELMKGDIGVKSIIGTGSTFWFSFTAKANNYDDENNNNTIKKENKSNIELNLNILLVEDQFVNRKVVTLMLENAGCKVDSAINGLVALEMVRNKYFEAKKTGIFYDLIFMDIQMPEMDGVTAVREMREKYNSLPPIIGLSANALEGDAEKYMSQGMDDYLSKPFGSKDLYELILKWKKNKD